jgi:hypothetical protein
MKWKKRISIWILISLSLQCLVLFYIDHYFLATNSKVVTKKVVEDESKKAKNIDITIPEGAKKILVSYDAKYLSYYENEQFKVVNCKDGSIKDIDAEEGSKVSFYKWLTDRNRMFFVEKNNDGESSNLVLYSYDLSKGEKVKIKELAWTNAKTEVEDIQVSTLTGLVYVKVSSESQGNNIYRFTRMVNENITKVNTIPNFVSNISIARHEDNLVYEGSVYNAIYVTGKDQPISVKGVEKLTLIGTDNNDNVYLGELKDKSISKIYYGKIAQKTEEWKEIDLKVPTVRKDLFISATGKVYQNDALRGVIKEVDSGTETSYQGKLLQLYTKGIASLVDNKISFVSFK